MDELFQISRCQDVDTRPINVARGKLEEIEQISNLDALNKIIIKGLFVLAVSSLEIMISDLLAYYLKSFPQKLKEKSFIVTKNDLLSFHTLDSIITKTINTLAYKGIDYQIKYLFSTLSIREISDLEYYISTIKEIKATRNLLLHNDLVVNETYVESAGEKRRTSSLGNQLRIDAGYFLNSIETIHQFLNQLETEIRFKYSTYTKVKMLKNLWEFMFSSPVMVFEDYWVIDEIGDGISAIKKCRYEDALSHSEQMMLGMWKAHFNNNPDNISFFNMNILDSNNKLKMEYFLSIAGDISFS